VPHARCLIVATGSSSSLASTTERALRAHGFDVQSVSAAADRLDLIEDGGAVLVAFDAAAPALGLQLCRDIGRIKPCSPSIALVDGGQRSAMVDALAVGAFDFIAFPCSAGEIVARVRRALGQVPSLPAAEPTTAHPRLKGIIGSSAGLAQTLSQIPLIASCDAGLLILGETGTGKEVFAQAVHYMSPRAPKPWVAVSCGAMPVELIESELFGHVKGAFTTAHCARRGWCQRQKAARFSSMTLTACRCRPKPNCCASCRSWSSGRSDQTA
jgi:two-component system response regulator GlrR